MNVKNEFNYDWKPNFKTNYRQNFLLKKLNKK